MKPTVEAILGVKPGSFKTFTCDTASQCHSACSLVYYINNCRRPASVRRYSTRVDWPNNIFAVFAEPADSNQTTENND